MDSTAVLIVDDNSDNLVLLQSILEQDGFRVWSAQSGPAALEIVARETLDLIMLDVYMPVMDGYEVCRRLKADPKTGDIPVIFVSASDSQADRIAAFDAGGVDYVGKPFFVGEVLGRARAHANLFRIRRHLEQRVAQRTRELEASEAHLRRLSEFLLRVREEDRRRFARELHDELGQSLTALRIDFNALTTSLSTRDPMIAERLATIDTMLNTTVDSVRRICEDLRPGMLDDLGLEAALASYARRFSRQFGILCDLSLSCEDFGLDEPMSTAIFRIVQEALTNIARHAEASHAMVALDERDGDLLVTIADDGRGLPPEPTETRQSFGIVGIRERVSLLRGTVTIDSAPGRGTHIEVRLPRSGGGAA
ncbi:ATP-binding response regulator [Propionivibrio dicarboxylicus]|uniref:Oxygen sensor histidine kinase NreB n=1 Tax=Propionivibrio dicarboxylicus TaxID=83767 RepID=A0A1G8KP65_9RHOO|nr:response regulator [Propionivibrio dicarboxylicus]SDI45197.1 Histidine kinase-, DNA gyrase B-, and HSP90-like ATPase [Propionivibrio dicarboxylicus]